MKMKLYIIPAYVSILLAIVGLMAYIWCVFNYRVTYGYVALILIILLYCYQFAARKLEERDLKRLEDNKK
jgi:hypothetical protein